MENSESTAIQELNQIIKLVTWKLKSATGIDIIQVTDSLNQNWFDTKCYYYWGIVGLNNVF